jgi:hypothetical protein
MKLLALALVVGCASEDMDLVELRTVRAMAGELPVAGIDSDGVGGLWIAYWVQHGGFDIEDEVRVVHLDAQGATLAEHRYTDLAAQPSGIAANADSVWLHYGGYIDPYQHRFVRELDPVTGAVRNQFDVPDEVIDLDIYGGELRLSTFRDQVISVNPQTGAEQWRTEGYRDSAIQRGIASKSVTEMWIAALDDRIYLLDKKRGFVGAGTHDVLDYDTWTVDVGMYLAWDGTHVIAAADGQIVWLLPDYDAMP